MTQTNQENNAKRLIGSVLKESFAPSGISMSTIKIPLVMLPDSDSIVCKRDDKNLSGMVRDMLRADGLRDNSSQHVMIHFYHGKELNDDAFKNPFVNSNIYKMTHRLEDNELYSCLVVTREPETNILENLAYKQTGKRGVYTTNCYLLKRIVVIITGELDASPHNEMLKILSD